MWGEESSLKFRARVLREGLWVRFLFVLGATRFILFSVFIVRSPPKGCIISFPVLGYTVSIPLANPLINNFILASASDLYLI